MREQDHLLRRGVSSYIPADVKRWSAETIVCDLDAGNWPRVRAAFPPPLFELGFCRKKKVSINSIPTGPCIP